MLSCYLGLQLQLKGAYKFCGVAWLEWLWFILGYLWVFYRRQGAVVSVWVLIKHVLGVGVQLKCPSFDLLLVFITLPLHVMDNCNNLEKWTGITFKDV